MNIKRKFFEYQTREDRYDYTAYNELMDEYKELLKQFDNGDIDADKIKVLNELNKFLANNEPYEVEERNFRRI